jgi:hypothetical protein
MQWILVCLTLQRVLRILRDAGLGYAAKRSVHFHVMIKDRVFRAEEAT